jgi:hypothetical protein
VTVRWTAPQREQIIEKTDLPDELIAIARASDAAVEEAERIEPFHSTGGPYRGGALRVNPEVNAVINGLLEHAPPDGKIVRERLAVRGVPVHQVAYHHRGRDRRLWIYGADHRVHAPGYPVDRLRLALALVALAAVLAGIVVVFAHLHPR